MNSDHLKDLRHQITTLLHFLPQQVAVGENCITIPIPHSYLTQGNLNRRLFIMTKSFSITWRKSKDITRIWYNKDYFSLLIWWTPTWINVLSMSSHHHFMVSQTLPSAQGKLQNWSSKRGCQSLTLKGWNVRDFCFQEALKYYTRNKSGPYKNIFNIYFSFVYIMDNHIFFLGGGWNCTPPLVI